MTPQPRQGLPALALCFALALAASGATATTIWRCGPEGRQFQAEPCAEGRVLESLQPRPAADLHAAQARLRGESARAAALRQERLRAESTRRPAGAAGIGHPGLAPPASDPPSGARPPRERARTSARRPELSSPARRPDAGAGTWRAVAPSSR